MALSKNLVKKEQDKFVEDTGETAVRVKGNVAVTDPVEISGEVDVNMLGLSTGGLMTEVTVNSSGWTLLPTTGLTSRQAISIQNQGTVEVKYNYTNSVGYVGKIIQPGCGEAWLDITEDVVLYGRSASSTATLLIEEIA